jgi:hypothetical protein
MRLPRSWTDADGAPAPAGPETVFSVEALKDLIDLLDALLQRA